MQDDQVGVVTVVADEKASGHPLATASVTASPERGLPMQDVAVTGKA